MWLGSEMKPKNDLHHLKYQILNINNTDIRSIIINNINNPPHLITRNWVCLCKACVGFSKYGVVIGVVITVTSQIGVIYSEIYRN